MIIKFLLLLIVFFVAPFGVFATTYYVSPAGNDNNNGNEATPWKTIQKAADIVSAGDTVNVLDGNYPEKITINHSGTVGMSITFQAQGTATTKGFSIGGVNPADHITIKNFKIENAIGKGIEVFGKGCVIENNYVYYSSDGGILLRTSSTDLTRTADCVVKNNRLERNAQFGIDVRGRNHLIEGNEIWDTIQHHPNRLPSPKWADADGIHFHGSGHTFKNNYIHDIKYDGTYVIDSHIDCFQTFETLPYQEAASNVTFDSNKCIIPYYCHSTSCLANPGQAVTKGFMLQQASKLTIKNNLIYAYNSIKSDRPAVDPRFTILNNTFIGLTDQNELQCSVGSNCWPAGIVLDGAINSIIKNNIFVDQLYRVIDLRNSTTGIDLDYNLAYRQDGNAPLGRPIAPFGQHDLWGVDPKFVNIKTYDYRLRSDSQAINTGVSVPVESDFDGISRPQGLGYDIGAYEYNGGSAQPTFTPTPTSIPNTPTPIPPTLTPTPTPIPGDIDRNKVVDMNDYNILLINFGKIGDNQADVNNSGKVDIYDYNFVIKNFGMSQ